MARRPKYTPSKVLRKLLPRTQTQKPKRIPKSAVKPGEVRNPKGINNPVKWAETRRVSHFLKQILESEGTMREMLLKGEGDRKEIHALKLARSAYLQAHLESAFLGIVLDRTEGKVPNPVELSGSGGGVIVNLNIPRPPDDDGSS